jgi:hypothetical protein
MIRCRLTAHPPGSPVRASTLSGLTIFVLIRPVDRFLWICNWHDGTVH